MKTQTISLDKFGILSIDNRFEIIFSVVLGSLFIAVFAQISIPLPFSPIPITGQTVAVLLLGGLLGSRCSAMAVLTYLMEGALGLPVFANMKTGAHILMGPTAGYLWGFVIAAFFIGYISEKGFNKSIISSFLYCVLATMIILASGVFYLSIFKVGFTQAMRIGFYPFVIGGIIKSLICASVFTGVKKLN